MNATPRMRTLAGIVFFVLSSIVAVPFLLMKIIGSVVTDRIFAAQEKLERWERK